MGWNKVMKAWGSGDEKVVAKNFEVLFNAGRSEDQARDPELALRWQSKSSPPPPSPKVSLRLQTSTQ